ncbi:GNAT family N-acetyltransferase [Candidatus Dojkabacteria bacterium]|nr:GNAT family N-acetyltransferase [Candidatus Dojkabacteria bacterium]
MGNKQFQLKKLSPTDGKDIYEMLQEMPADENGFENKFKGLSFEEYKEKLKLKDSNSRGENLPEGYVAATFFWLYFNGKPVGVSKLRHELTDHLRKYGGHIGYGIRPKERGKGYATKMLELTLEEAKKLGLRKVLITCNPDNIGSQRVAEKNGGILKEKTEETWYYWVDLN